MENADEITLWLTRNGRKTLILEAARPHEFNF